MSEVTKDEVARLRARVEALEIVVLALLEEHGPGENHTAPWIKAANSPHSTLPEITGTASQILARLRHVRRARAGQN